ncbi:redox-sensing transcriptional repressor [Abditibacterium utsteinense]|uniref:Redox-sensing transcriptional repressor Rex n=1 Tax=Abditibacterium utsteinense TaxID=1960156 RepID=A0A2S8SXI2_9BACT|nr:redox-sensing transcriptional repressor Rex [Abditibacterium utsteinense]PQV65510.1 redox-sensing transcriptional repressor [Abditibacterium utsteinense]
MNAHEEELPGELPDVEKAAVGLAKIPPPTIERLSVYLQCVRALQDEDKIAASSAEIAKRTGIHAAQLRKDLSYFGEFGTPGLGYDLRALETHLSRIMGLDLERDVLLIGAGNLGRALSSYTGFGRRGFRIVAAFDVDENVVGTDIGPVAVHHMRDLSRVNASLGAEVGVIAVPTPAAAAALDALVAAGVRAVLNFAPVALGGRPGVTVRNVDLTSQMEILSYYLSAK